MFYAKGPGARRPDEITAGGEMLKKGEVGVSYLLGSQPTDLPDRPVVVTPLVPGTKRFDRKGLNGKVVVLFKNNSVTLFPIDRHGRVLLDGRDVMDPLHPVWEGRSPEIAWPEIYRAVGGGLTPVEVDENQAACQKP